MDNCTNRRLFSPKSSGINYTIMPIGTSLKPEQFPLSSVSGESTGNAVVVLAYQMFSSTVWPVDMTDSVTVTDTGENLITGADLVSTGLGPRKAGWADVGEKRGHFWWECPRQNSDQNMEWTSCWAPQFKNSRAKRTVVKRLSHCASDMKMHSYFCQL